MSTTTAVEKVGNVSINYEAVLNTLSLNPRDPNVQALLLICERYELDPVLKHMLLIKGQTYVTHKGLWHLAHRSNLLDGHEILEEGETDKEYFARVSIYRKDWSRPVTMKGRYPKSGTNKQYGQEMAVTRAECLVLRRLFDVAVPVYEEINWQTEDRGGGAAQPTSDRTAASAARAITEGGPSSKGHGLGNSEGATAAPPPNVDATTGEVLDITPADDSAETLVAKSNARRSFAPPGAAAPEPDPESQLTAQPDSVAILAARIDKLDQGVKLPLSLAWKEAGLPPIKHPERWGPEQVTAAHALIEAELAAQGPFEDKGSAA